MNSKQVNIRNLLTSNYGVNIDDSTSDGISIDYILENKNDLMNTLEYFTQNINNLRDTARENLAVEKQDFLKYNKKYTVIFNLIEVFIEFALSDDSKLKDLVYSLILVKILFKYILVAITNQKDRVKFDTAGSMTNPGGIERALSLQQTSDLKSLARMGEQLAARDETRAKTADNVAMLDPKTDAAPAVPMDIDNDHNQKLVRPAPDSPPKATGTSTKPKDGASASANSPMGPRRGSISVRWHRVSSCRF